MHAKHLCSNVNARSLWSTTSTLLADGASADYHLTVWQGCRYNGTDTHANFAGAVAHNSSAYATNTGLPVTVGSASVCVCDCSWQRVLQIVHYISINKYWSPISGGCYQKHIAAILRLHREQFWKDVIFVWKGKSIALFAPRPPSRKMRTVSKVSAHSDSPEWLIKISVGNTDATCHHDRLTAFRQGHKWVCFHLVSFKSVRIRYPWRINLIF